MTEPPTFEDLQKARADERHAVEATLQQAEQTPENVREIARTEAKHSASTISRRYGKWGLAFTIIVPTIVSLLAVGLVLDNRAATDQLERAQVQSQQTIDAALDKQRQFNEQLIARGQAPVPEPDEPTNPAEALAAAVTANVLAALPPEPNADQVGAAIQTAVVANLLGPTRAQLTSEVSAYFAANPPQPGPGPTPQQIQEAVDRAYAANPPKDGDPGKDGVDGAPGPAGRSVTGQEFVRVDGACTSRVTFSDGDVEDRPAGEAACPPF